MINSLIMNTETPSRLAFHFIVKPEDNYPAAYFVAELEQRWPDLYFDHRIWRHWERVLSAGYPSNSRFSNSLNIGMLKRARRSLSFPYFRIRLADWFQLASIQEFCFHDCTKLSAWIRTSWCLGTLFSCGTTPMQRINRQLPHGKAMGHPFCSTLELAVPYVFEFVLFLQCCALSTRCV